MSDHDSKITHSRIEGRLSLVCNALGLTQDSSVMNRWRFWSHLCLFLFLISGVWAGLKAGATFLILWWMGMVILYEKCDQLRTPHRSSVSPNGDFKPEAKRSLYSTAISPLRLIMAFSLLFILWPLLLLYIFRPFQQQRVGQNQQPFFIRKIKTLHEEKPIDALSHILRRTGLDEVPQLINLLRLEMAFVGPRPELLSKQSSFYELGALRTSVLPGVTGLWQISRFRSFPIADHLEHDLVYLQFQSWWLDLCILALTPYVAVRRLFVKDEPYQPSRRNI